MKPNILVTGGAGYIGSHTCKALSRAGFCPVTYDNLVYGHEWAVRWGPFERGDILDVERLGDVLRVYCPVGAIHFAAFTYVGQSVTDPQRYYENNVLGSLRLAQALVGAGIRALVFSSTCATYGIPETVPIREDTPQRPINPYGNTKLAVERMFGDFDGAYGLRHVNLRYFNAAGADEDGEIGESHAPETHLIPLAIESALDRDKELKVFGLDYETPDGSAVRDYVHVEDLAQAHVAAIRYLLNGGSSTALNVGTGHGASVLEVIAAVDRAARESKVSWEPAPRRPGDPPVLVSDPARLKDILDLDPGRFRGLDEIVRTAWRWHVHSGTGHRLPDGGFRPREG
jgi:UDP-arabinose 4-epimerase